MGSTDAYRPLADHLAQRMAATRGERRGPFVIGIGGSVAAGKSTTARILQELLASRPEHPTVEIVPTDGFLLPNAVLDERGISARKGFPESYDSEALVRFLDQLATGDEEVRAPIYSHVTYDVVGDEAQVLRQPDVVIVEGVNVLQTGGSEAARYDVTIYVDADDADVERWFTDRLLALLAAAETDEGSFYRPFAAFSDEERRGFASAVWASINRPNLHDHILPMRDRADVVIEKAADHSVRQLHLPA